MNIFVTGGHGFIGKHIIEHLKEEHHCFSPKMGYITIKNTMNNCKEKLNCICCDSTNLFKILDLNSQPLANSYHKLDEVLESFPLALNLCLSCYHLQLSHIVNPNLLFKHYLYVSGTTKTLHEYFDWFVNFVSEYTEKTSGTVLDIACNDGTQLNYFKKYNWDTYGVEPAENLYQICNENHNVKCDYFRKNLFDGKKFDVITAQNVFAHLEGTKEFLNDCYELMDDSSLLFIQTSQSELINSYQYDTLYHEHLSFFNINSMNELSKRSKLFLIDVIKTHIHGISYIFVFSKKKKNQYLIKNHIAVEKEKGLLNINTYKNYNKKVIELANEFSNNISEYRKKGYKIIGYGAAAKGMTVLNFTNVKLDFIIDDNPLKHNLYTPGSDILIVSSNILSKYDENEKIVFVSLAWNFFNEIKNKILALRNNKNDVFLTYFPIKES